MQALPVDLSVLIVGELPDEQQSWATRWDYSATYRPDLRASGPDALARLTTTSVASPST